MLSAQGRTEFLLEQALMSLTLFVSLCVLGCDFLIYFLYEWAFGERRRTRMRKDAARRRSEVLADSQSRPAAASQNNGAAQPVIVLDANRRKRPTSFGRPSRLNEELAYRRVAASFAQVKRRA